MFFTYVNRNRPNLYFNNVQLNFVDHHFFPLYLSQLFPPTVEHVSSHLYSLRNNANYASIARRTEIYAKSVIPSSIQLWNELPAHIRESETFQYSKISLKHYIKLLLCRHFISKAIVYLLSTMLVLEINIAIWSLTYLQIILCDCGTLIEDAEHFLFQCRKYTIQRRKLFTNTREFHPLSTKKLLFGIENLLLLNAHLL